MFEFDSHFLSTLKLICFFLYSYCSIAGANLPSARQAQDGL